MGLKIINAPDDPFLLLAILAIGIGLGFAAHMLLAARQKKAWRAFYQGRDARARSAREFSPASGPGRSDRGAGQKAGDAADQLRIVMGASFSAKPLLNRGEARLFKELDRMVLGCNPDWQVMAQVSLGEILKGNTPEAHSCINSKRVDLLLVDEQCQPRHAIEYQGSGHHQGSAAARDAVKKEALRRAGIGYHEVVAGKTTPSELRRMIEGLVGRPASAIDQTGSSEGDEIKPFGKAEPRPMATGDERRAG